MMGEPVAGRARLETRLGADPYQLTGRLVRMQRRHSEKRCLIKSTTWARYSSPKPKVVRVHLGHVPELDTDDRSEKSAFRIAILVAVVLHLGFFLVQLPELIASPEWTASKQQVYVIQQVQFKPPAPAAEPQKPKPKEKRRMVPIPDPTPDEPEPIPDRGNRVC